jgi:hypothetical protein
MASGDLSPLQLTAGAGFVQNQGITLNSAFSGNIATYEAVPLIATLLTAISLATTANIGNSTIQSMRSLGSSALGNSFCPALGDSIPSTFSNVAPWPTTGNAVFSTAIKSVGNVWLGSGDVGKFSQAFSITQGYAATANLFIRSAVQANDYLGPTFTTPTAQITADVAQVNLAFPPFGNDLTDLGNAISLADIEQFGEPAALLRQLVNVGKGVLPCVQSYMTMMGLSTTDVNDMVTDNRQSLFNPTGLTDTQFNKLQARAYAAMTFVDGTCLDEVLAVLDVTTPNIDNMADLLDPKKIFPTSWPSLTMMDQLIYLDNGAVNPALEPILNATTPTGCDELGKVVPPQQAVASKAVQYQLQQINGITNVSLPELAAILR